MPRHALPPMLLDADAMPRHYFSLPFDTLDAIYADVLFIAR